MATTKYQKLVNSQTGALGPTTSAFWKKMTTIKGAPWSLKAQPLVYDTTSGKYITSYAAPAVNQSMNTKQGTVKLSFGNSKRKSKRRPKTHKKRKSFKKRTRKNKRSRKSRKL